MARDDDEDRPRRPRRYDDRDDEYRPPPPKSNAGLLIGILAGVFLVVCGGGGFLVWQFMRAAQGVVAQAQAQVAEAEARVLAEQETIETNENLDRIGVALHNYDDVHNRLPNDTYGLGPKKAGVTTPKPLLSWRVHLLPSLGHEPLYKRFKLDEPWDSPNNKPLIDQMPAVYGRPAEQTAAGPGKTFYRGFCHAGAVFEKPRVPNQPNPVSLASIRAADGLPITIAVIEAAEPIEWTRPDELDWSPGAPRPNFGGTGPKREFFLALMMDGTVQKVRMTVPDKTLRDLIHRSDGMVIGTDWKYP
ncbi:MAG TPA: DUF1559 domain-containing protein [Gemmataceae bacterium]|jgi:hypothetical protein|nr:DUF1559 domain-containing protein [Gemmataceae bacterium]